MTNKEFELIARDRIIHSRLGLGDGKRESPYGTRDYGFRTVCRFYENSLRITEYSTHDLLLEIPYDELAEVELSVCSRLSGYRMIPYSIFFGRMILKRNDFKKFVIEYKLTETLPAICELLISQHVKIVDEMGIVAAVENYDQEELYKFIESNIKMWSGQYHLDHPKLDDMITVA